MHRYSIEFETQKINWDSFELKVHVLDDAKVNMINLFSNIISSSDLKSFCFKYYKDESGVVHEVIYGFVWGLMGGYWITSTQCMPTDLKK